MGKRWGKGKKLQRKGPCHLEGGQCSLNSPSLKVEFHIPLKAVFEFSAQIKGFSWGKIVEWGMPVNTSV